MILPLKPKLNLKLYIMKRYLFSLVFLFLTIHLISQSIKLDSIIDKNDGCFLLVLKLNNEILDTFSKSSFKIKLIDSYYTDNIISYIYEAPLHIGYDKYIKTDSGWVWSNTSGMIARNPSRITSAPIPALIKESKKKREYKIIADDLVSIKVDGVETIKDCNDFRIEREAREREYQEWIKKREQEKK